MTALLANVLLVLLVVGNLLFLDYSFFIKPPASQTQITAQSVCPSSCRTLVADVVSKQPSPACACQPSVSNLTLKSPSVSSPSESQPSTSYIPIPGSGSTIGTSWQNLSGTEFYLDTSDYPNLKNAYFEANMKLFNGNGTAYLRLFDVTAGIEVWGSEVSTGSQNFTSVVSDTLTLRSGNHLYRVQGKSLTADTTVFNSGRIKIVTK